MTNNALLSAIKGLAERTNAKVGTARWYLFGSAKIQTSQAEDIDLLVVCETSETADELRHLVDLDCLTRPIHLSILTEIEEEEVSFIERQRCVQII